MSRISISHGTTGARDRSVASMVFSTLERFFRSRQRRHDARLLSDLPDYLLRDIGIQRGMILSAVRHGRGRD